MKHEVIQERENHVVEQTDAHNYLVRGRLIGYTSGLVKFGTTAAGLGRYDRTILKLYLSDKGKYLGQKVVGEKKLAKSLKNTEAVVEFFGYGDLAKELYDQANIPHLMIID